MFGQDNLPLLLWGVAVLALGAGCAAAETRASGASEVTLVRDGRAVSAIFFPAGTDNVRYTAAAGELAKHIKLMTGVELPVLIEDAESGQYRSGRIERARLTDDQPVDPADFEGHLPIRIGDAADAGIDELIRGESGISDAFALVVSQDAVQLRGLGAVGAQHAAYELLEQLGVRWNDPLEDGRVTPQTDTLTLAHQRTVKTPSWELRWLPPVTPRSTLYTFRMKEEHIRMVRESPYVTATPSADENFVLGRTAGCDDPDLIYEAAHIQRIVDMEGNPAVDLKVAPRNIYGYRITDPDSDEQKITVVITDGNHREDTGSWSFHAMIEFILSDEPEAETLRRKVDFYVYPLVNPDGRYVMSRVRSPEVAEAGWHNHNRIWTTAGLFSTIDILSAAMRYDTRCQVDYHIDYHSGAAHSIYVPNDLLESAFIRAMVAREGKRPVVFEATGTTIHFAVHEDGLRSPRGYTPENDDWKPLAHCLQVGRNYALSLYDVITGKYDDSGEGVQNYRTAFDAGSPPPLRQRDASDLLQAVAAGNLDAAKESLANGDEIDATNSNGNTALHLAAEQGYHDIAQWLIDEGADVSASNGRGWTPLHYAARYWHTDIARLLVEHGAVVNAPNEAQDTALHIAAAYNRPDVVAMLLEAGADAAAQGRWDRTPSDWARRLGHAEVLELFE